MNAVLRSPGPSSWWRLPLIFVVLMGVMAVALPLFADGLIYFPDDASRRAPAGMQKIPSEAGEIAVLHLPNSSARFTLWFFHGNAESLGDLEPFLLALRDAGYAVFAFDYPGYGQSTGKPTEKTVYASARAARAYLRDVARVPAEKTILFGRSLGGGPAVQMALEERNAGLVLQSTFMSAFRVVTRWRVLPFDQYENLKKLARVNSPVLVMHGRADEVIAFGHAEKLLAAAKEPKRHLWVERAGHNDFLSVAGADFWQTLRDFSALCALPIAASP
jgi:fermentation-respiration switch protein FrsA (DUF1100 family)